MFVEYIYIYKQYNPETARQNTSKLKYSVSIEKIKYLSKRNWQSMDLLTWREIDRLLIIPSLLPSTGCAPLLSCHYPFSFPLASLFPYTPPNRPNLSIFGNIHGILPTSSPLSVICLAGCHCGLPLYGASWHSTPHCTWPATLV